MNLFSETHPYLYVGAASDECLDILTLTDD